jgi:ribosomal protein S18 acetylase RimI-like enzyme
MMLIRDAQLKDMSELREVAISSYRDAFAPFNTKENMDAYIEESYTLQILGKELNEPSSKIFLVCEDKKIVGFSRLRESDEVAAMLGSNAIELQRLYVLTAVHGKSAGKFLMESNLTYAREKGYSWIWLGVWERNFRAQQFYKKWGFEKFSEHTFWMGDDPQIDWLLRKKLIG